MTTVYEYGPTPHCWIGNPVDQHRQDAIDEGLYMAEEERWDAVWIWPLTQRIREDGAATFEPTGEAEKVAERDADGVMQRVGPSPEMVAIRDFLQALGGCPQCGGWNACEVCWVGCSGNARPRWFRILKGEAS